MQSIAKSSETAEGGGKGCRKPKEGQGMYLVCWHVLQDDTNLATSFRTPSQQKHSFMRAKVFEMPAWPPTMKFLWKKKFCWESLLKYGFPWWYNIPLLILSIGWGMFCFANSHAVAVDQERVCFSITKVLRKSKEGAVSS